jgi:hypothetical protein
MIYLLKPLESWHTWYDKVFGFVVCANDEKEASQLASDLSECEGTHAWLDPKITFCVPLLDSDLDSRVILRDFHRS